MPAGLGVLLAGLGLLLLVAGVVALSRRLRGRRRFRAGGFPDAAAPGVCRGGDSGAGVGGTRLLGGRRWWDSEDASMSGGISSDSLPMTWKFDRIPREPNSR